MGDFEKENEEVFRILQDKSSQDKYDKQYQHMKDMSDTVRKNSQSGAKTQATRGTHQMSKKKKSLFDEVKAKLLPVLLAVTLTGGIAVGGVAAHNYMLVARAAQAYIQTVKDETVWNNVSYKNDRPVKDEQGHYVISDYQDLIEDIHNSQGGFDPAKLIVYYDKFGEAATNEIISQYNQRYGSMGERTPVSGIDNVANYFFDIGIVKENGPDTRDEYGRVIDSGLTLSSMKVTQLLGGRQKAEDDIVRSEQIIQDTNAVLGGGK